MEIRNPLAQADILVFIRRQDWPGGKEISRREEYIFNFWKDDNTKQIDSQLRKMGWRNRDIPCSAEEHRLIIELHNRKNERISEMERILGRPKNRKEAENIEEAYADSSQPTKSNQ